MRRGRGRQPGGRRRRRRGGLHHPRRRTRRDRASGRDRPDGRRRRRRRRRRRPRSRADGRRLGALRDPVRAAVRRVRLRVAGGRARSAARSVVDVDDGESAIRAANVLAVFLTAIRASMPIGRSQARAPACRRVRSRWRVGRAAASPALRYPGRPPAGRGVDRDEAQDQGEPVVVGGLHYNALLARRLNPSIAPDKAMLSGRKPRRRTRDPRRVGAVLHERRRSRLRSRWPRACTDLQGGAGATPRLPPACPDRR